MVTLICGIVGVANSMFPVDIDTSQLVGHLKKAIKAENPKKITCDANDLELFLAKTTDGEWLSPFSEDGMKLKNGEKTDHVVNLLQIDLELQTMDYVENVLSGMGTPAARHIHVLVVVPKEDAPSVVPRTFELQEPKKFLQECDALFNWGVSADEYILHEDESDPVVHEIPTICKFMSDLGGCTKTGKIVWRVEEKKIVALIVDGWFRKSSSNNDNPRAGRGSILLGSPGIGKSTLLCMVAFYLVFVHKKNVLVFRKLRDMDILLFLGYEKKDNEDKFVYFSVVQCDVPRAISIYKQLKGTLDVWLLLDGFRFEDVPRGLQAFEMLATSQQTRQTGAGEDVYSICLLPCWSKTDLFFWGETIHDFGYGDMEKRYDYSSGSVRWFTMPDLASMRDIINESIGKVSDPTSLLSCPFDVLTGNDQVAYLSRTFWKTPKKLSTYKSDWEQVIDSRYVVQMLGSKLRRGTLNMIYMWSKNLKAPLSLEPFLRNYYIAWCQTTS